MAQRATCSFHYERSDGGPGYVALDQVVSDDHEALKGRESFFLPVADATGPDSDPDGGAGSDAPKPAPKPAAKRTTKS